MADTEISQARPPLQLAPDIASVVEKWRKSYPQTTLEEIRAGARALSPTELLINMAHVEDRWIMGFQEEVPIRIYWPVLDRQLPVIMYYHGGGISGDLDMFDHVCRVFAKRTESLVISVAYGLAPEHKFPEYMEDSFAALQWAATNILNLNGDPKRIVVCGDSAGGTIATVMTLMARDRNGPSIAYQVLIYPATNFSSQDTPSWHEFGADEKEATNWVLSLAINKPSELFHPYLSPFLHKDHRNLPPAFVITVVSDVYRDEGFAYTQKLQAAGVDVEYRCFESLPHGFVVCAHLAPSAQKALEEIADFLGNKLNA
ncbi:MAG: alpha/beta hydrolase [Caldilineaceae bacterium]